MSNISKLVKAVDGATGSLPPEKQFIQDLTYAIEKEASLNERKPSKTFKPSSIGGCARNIYFQLIGADMDEEKQSCSLVGICESGTDRHIRIQQHIIDMSKYGIDCEYVDIADYVAEHHLDDIEIISKDGIETKCYNKKYNISFLTDGIIKYKGTYYILEIKTETSRKYWEHNDVRAEHKAQGITYYLSFGINKILYLYECRDTTDKKAFLFKVTEKSANEIRSKIKLINEYLETETIPPKEEDKKKCAYCSYKTECEKYGNQQQN